MVLNQFSQALLEIYRLAREEPLERFLQTMLECVQSIIPFRSAWWGRGAPSAEAPERLHSYYLLHLPPEYFTDWKSIRDDDNTVEEVFKKPGEAIILNIDNPDIHPGLKWLGERYEFHELMCVISLDEITGLSNHLSIYRAKEDNPFTPLERQLLESLMPHLLSAASINQIRSLYALLESRSDSHMALAVCTRDGVLLSSEPGLVDLLLTEWPEWRGPTLPFLPDATGYQGKSVVIDTHNRDDLYLLVARQLYPIEQLSTREQDVATRFGQGLTYKEIARDIGVSPNTVRHYLRSIYRKLGINNKADIGRLLHDIPINKPT
ncbi:LuxR C-terminal-related transcriptional regulator [Marinobacterium sp. D7]|nr:LuxR C-terminal-related transcriptional regulator [Marinobacterium ramblicola]